MEERSEVLRCMARGQDPGIMRRGSETPSMFEVVIRVMEMWWRWERVWGEMGNMGEVFGEGEGEEEVGVVGVEGGLRIMLVAVVGVIGTVLVPKLNSSGKLSLLTVK